MSREMEHIDQQIREKLFQADISPAAAVWDGLEKALAKERKAVIFLIYRRVGFAAAVLLLGFLAYYFSRSDRNIIPPENKLTQQVIDDSLTAVRDAVSVANFEKQELDEIEIYKKQPELNELKIAMPVISVQNESDINKEKLESKYAQTIYKEQVIKYISIKQIESIAFRKPSYPEEIFSLYKSNFNPLSLFKANVYKHNLDYEKDIILLAENSSKTSSHGLSIGLAFSPTSIQRSSGLFTPNSDAFYDMANSEMSYVSEKDIPAYAGGINLVYQISERWSFQSGIYYLKQGQSIENFSVLENSINASNSTNSFFGNIIFYNSNVIAESGSITDFAQLTDAITYTRFNADLLQQFELLEIPFLATYKIINRKTVFSVLAGFNSGFLVGNSVYLTDYSSKPVGKTEAVNKLIYKSVFGVSFEYPLSRKLYFSLSPMIKYQLNNFNKNAIVSEQLQYFEFKTGLNYRF